MLAAVVSDLHLGIHTGADLLRRPEMRARLFDALAGVDEVVLLGDSIELRDGLARGFARARASLLRGARARHSGSAG